MKNIIFTLVVMCVGVVHFGTNTVSGANILVFGPVGSYSQRISMWSYIEGLSDKGHNVTFLSPYESRDPNPRIHDYVPKKWKNSMGEWEAHLSFYDIRKNRQIIRTWFRIPSFGVFACEMLYEDEEFVTWVKSSKFDLVVVDGLMNECGFSLVHFWNSKMIIYSTSFGYSWYGDQHGLPDETSSIPDILSIDFEIGEGTTFYQRLLNAMLPLAWNYYRTYWYLPTLEEISKKGLGITEIPSFLEIERNASLVFLTNHYSIGYPKSLPPNVIDIGGVAVAAKQKPLPKEMEEFIQKGKEGFIYISFGTVAEFVNFERSVQDEFIKGISSFPEIPFVWKSQFEINQTLPKHVMVTKWAPQQGLLAHPKIKAFISHSGMGSTTETVHFGVPIISCPVLAEQDLNGGFVASKGAGIKLEITKLTKSDLENAIKEVVYTSKYRDGMKRVSTFSKDRPMTATDTAVWWTEFVLRHDNTNDFLQSPSVHQPWWVRRQIDVWLVATALLIIIITTPTYLVYSLLRCLFCLKSKKNVLKSRSNKKKQK